MCAGQITGVTTVKKTCPMQIRSSDFEIKTKRAKLDSGPQSKKVCGLDFCRDRPR